MIMLTGHGVIESGAKLQDRVVLLSKPIMASELIKVTSTFGAGRAKRTGSSAGVSEDPGEAMIFKCTMAAKEFCSGSR